MSVFDPAPAVDDLYGDLDGSGDAPIVSLDGPKNKNVARVVAGVGIVAFAALVGAYAFAASSPDTTRVMVAEGDLVVGEPITAANMRTVEIGSAAGLDSVSPDEQDVLIGLTPRAAVPDGTVLNTGLFIAEDESIPVGKVIVGAVLEPGSTPTNSLRIGDPVGLIAVVATLNADSVPSFLGQGEVWAIGPASADVEEVWVSVLIDEALQIDVAQAASTSQLWVTAVRS